MQVFPTAPSPTVTHLMNLEALEAIETKPNQTKEEKEEEEGLSAQIYTKSLKPNRKGLLGLTSLLLLIHGERERERESVCVCVATHMILTHSLFCSNSFYSLKAVSFFFSFFIWQMKIEFDSDFFT